jgi:hypothetical protein
VAVICEELMHHGVDAPVPDGVPRVIILAEDRARGEPPPHAEVVQKPFEMKTLVRLALSMLSP